MADLKIKTARALKDLQRAKRDQFPESLGVRVHRAISWLMRAEQSEDLDGRFIFLWISFNAAYSNDLGRISIAESEQLTSFLTKLVELDTEKRLYNIAWHRYPNAIRVLLDNKYVFQPF